jgi:HPt (histidine-containing phosphotransfer) domain-containing protein
MNERLDHGLLDELRALLEDDFGTLLKAYLEDSEHQLHEVSDALEEGNLDRLRRSAHSLKGASSNVGAVALAALCGRLEQLALDGSIDSVPEALERMRNELREVRDEIVAVHQIH